MTTTTVTHKIVRENARSGNAGNSADIYSGRTCSCHLHILESRCFCLPARHQDVSYSYDGPMIPCRDTECNDHEGHTYPDCRYLYRCEKECPCRDPYVEVEDAECVGNSCHSHTPPDTAALGELIEDCPFAKEQPHRGQG